jgi:electron transfer flavoprotein alpha subunit
MNWPYMPSARRVLFFAVMCWSMAPARAEGLDGLWRLRVNGLDHQAKVAATIRFSAESAKSCMVGDWKRVIVVAKAAEDEAFFPLAQPLAYKLDGAELTLGRAQVCDAYLFLGGQLNGTLVRGGFDAVGWGTRRLGDFSLEKLRWPK